MPLSRLVHCIGRLGVGSDTVRYNREKTPSAKDPAAEMAPKPNHRLSTRANALGPALPGDRSLSGARWDALNDRTACSMPEHSTRCSSSRSEPHRWVAFQPMRCDVCGDGFPKWNLDPGPVVVPLPGGHSTLSDDSWSLCDTCRDSLDSGDYGLVRANAVMNGTDVDDPEPSKAVRRDAASSVMEVLRSAYAQGAALSPLSS